MRWLAVLRHLPRLRPRRLPGRTARHGGHGGRDALRHRRGPRGQLAPVLPAEALRGQRPLRHHPGNAGLTMPATNTRTTAAHPAAADGTVRTGLLIIGASQSGVQLAVSLRALGFDEHITLLGDEAHRPYQRPALSKEFLQ